jgi:hypothetical protein
VRYYHTSKAANRVNAVTVADLTPGVYYYQVGDGNTWSEPMAFTVKAETAGSSVSFGFTPVADLAKLATIADAMAKSGITYDFLAQTGNTVTDVDTYDAWMQAVTAAQGFGQLDLIYADVRENGGAMLNGEAMYTRYVYGNVFVAVLNYNEDETAMKAALEDMMWDAKELDYDCRVLIANRASSVTDEKIADAVATMLIPSMADRSSLDLVIAANADVYTRTEPLYNGAPAAVNGVTYLFCGNDPAYNALYLTVSYESGEITVTVNNVLADGSVETVDTFTKAHTTCADGAHLYRLGNHSTYLVCDLCNAKVKFGEHEGLFAVNDSFMYRMGGGLARGWVEYNGNTYYMDFQTFTAVDGVQNIGGLTFVFRDHVLVEGAWAESGDHKKLYWGFNYLTSTWHTQAGKTYYLQADGSCAVGTVEISHVDEYGNTVTETYIFDEDGALIGKA